MPPKFKFLKEEIVSAALAIAREDGLEAVTARAVGKRLGASSKVIFGSFENMDALHGAVISAARKLNTEMMVHAMSEGKYPSYKASGMAYIRFAREEKELYKLLYLRDRSLETVSEIEDRQQIQPIIDGIRKSTGLSADSAYLLHLEMWIFVHGIAAMIATSYLDWDEDFVSKALSDVYSGLKHRFCKEENKIGSHKD